VRYSIEGGQEAEVEKKRGGMIKIRTRWVGGEKADEGEMKKEGRG
jgi:hypothetical protein